MKYICLLLFIFPLALKAQQDLQFDKKFIESEDQWVAFSQNEDSTYSYGFIYIDAQAGLTLNYEGRFTISPAGVFIPKKLDSTNIKYRLQPNNVKVAWIPSSKYAELKINAVPEWLHFYKNDTSSVQRLFQWGYMYNGWDMCAKALDYLERAQKKDPEYKGLRVELAFSYNCLGDYNKAIAVLEAALKNEPTNTYINKELIFALVSTNKMDEASTNLKRILSTCKDTTYHAEMCYNVIRHYYMNKDKAHFTQWLKEAGKWIESNDDWMKSVKTMEKNMASEK